MECARNIPTTKRVISELKQLNITIAVLIEIKKKGQVSENLRLYDHFYSEIEKEKRIMIPTKKSKKIYNIFGDY